MTFLKFNHSRKNKDLVTVVSVTLNEKDALDKTIQSVLGQNYPKLEHVIVDGGSTDGSLDIIKSYSADNFSIKWISEGDNGIYDAMNKGVRLAEGKWINFLNSGDTFKNKKVISQVVKEITPSDDLVYGDTCFISDDKQEIILATNPDTLWQAINFNHNSLFVRRELLLEHPFDKNYKIVADSEFVIWCYKKGYCFKNTKIVINNYPRGGYADENSIMRTIERWKLVSDYKMKEQDEINQYYFQRLLWEDYYKEFLKKQYNLII